MNFFKDGHMTSAARKLDSMMAAQDQYWDAELSEYRHEGQDTPGKELVVHYIAPGEVQIENVRDSAGIIAIDQSIDAA